MTEQINNEIQESYCSFEVSKLLKEKGCGCQNGKIAYAENGVNCERLASAFFNDEVYPYQTISHALAIEWIRVNFGIWPHAEYLFGKFTPNISMDFNFLAPEQVSDVMNWIKTRKEYDKPSDAHEAALLYTLKNLIP